MELHDGKAARLVFAWIAGFCITAGAHAQSAAKELFMGLDGQVLRLEKDSDRKDGFQPVRQPRVLGLQVTVYQLFEDGGSRAVSPKTVFSAGDRIRLGFHANRPGFLYVVNVGTTGKVATLFPSSATDNNQVRPGFVYQIPQQAGRAIRFDKVPGEEIILVVLAESRISDVHYGGQTIALGTGGSTAGEAAAPPQAQQILVAALETASTSKDLFVADEGPIRTVAMNPASDAAARSKPLITVLKLVHH